MNKYSQSYKKLNELEKMSKRDIILGVIICLFFAAFFIFSGYIWVFIEKIVP